MPRKNSASAGDSPSSSTTRIRASGRSQTTATPGNRSPSTRASTARTSSCAVPCVSSCSTTRSLYRSATIPGSRSASEKINRQASFAALTRSNPLPQLQRLAHPLRHVREIRLTRQPGNLRNHPQRNLRSRAIQRAPDRPAPIEHRHHASRLDPRSPPRRQQFHHLAPVQPTPNPRAAHPPHAA